MKNLKKFLAIVLSFALTISLWSTAATAAIVIDDPGQDNTVNATFYDGDTVLPEISTSVAEGDSITLPTYSKTGSNFEGWKINNEGTLYKAGETYTVNDNVDFYAQFSQGAYVAAVIVEGGSVTNCATMEEARVAALQAGETPVTIQLLKDIGISTRLQLRDPDDGTDALARNITIDLNGFTLSKEATMNGFFFINKGATVTVKGGTLDCKTFSGYMFGGNTDSTTIVESGTFTNYSKPKADVAILKVSGGTWDEPPIEYLADGYEAIKNEDGTHFDVVAKTGDDIYSLSDGTNEATFASMDALQVAIDYFAGKRTNIKLLGDVTTDARIGLVAGTETAPIEYNYDFNGHKLTYTGTSNGFVLMRAYDTLNINNSANSGGLTVSGQAYYFSSNKNASTLTVKAGTYEGGTSFGNANTVLAIQGGTWNIDPTAYVDTTAYEVKENAGVYRVNPLGGGNVAEVTIGGAATEYATIEEAFAAANAATGNVDIKMLADTTVSATITVTQSAYPITFDLNGKTITSDVQFLKLNTTSKTSKGFTINDTVGTGKIVSTATAISNGFIYNNVGGDLVINGGTFQTAQASGYLINASGYKAAHIIVNGGTFKAAGATLVRTNSSNVTINAGLFYGDPASKVVATTGTKTITGEVINNQDGTWTVKGADPVCEIVGGDKYMTFDEGIAALASAGTGTLKLLADCEKTTSTTTIAVDTSVTLDLNGFALTNTYANTTVSSTYHRYFKVNGTLTITDSSADKKGSITVNAEYTGKAAISSADGGTVYVNAGNFFDGNSQGESTNNCWMNANNGTHVITGGWFSEYGRPTSSTAYVPSGSTTIEVLDIEKAATPYTITSTYKTINYSKNAKDATGTVESAKEYYVEGYTIAPVYAKTNQYTLKNYSFMGWSTNNEADPDTDPLVAAGGVIDITQYSGDVIEFFAIWKEVDTSMWVCVKTGDPTTGYADLAAALSAEDDVTLIKNITDRTTITAAGTINLNGYNIVPTAAGSALVIKAAVSIKNFDAGTITVAGIDYNFGGEGKVQGTAQGTGGAIDAGEGATVKIYGGTYIGDAPTHGTVLTCTKTGMFLIYGGTFKPLNAESEVDAFYANNSKIYVLADTQSDVKMTGTFAKNTSGEIGIQGGWFSELQPAAKVGTYDDVQGTFAEDTTKSLKAITGDETYAYAVAGADALVVNRRTGEIYSTFEAAYNAAEEDDTLALLGNVTVEGFTFDKDITVDLDGYEITDETDVADGVEVRFINVKSYSSPISSAGFVYFDGTLTTDGIVGQTKTAQKIEYVGGNIKATLGATFYARVALKAGDAIPNLTYEDPLKGTTVMDATNVGGGVVTYTIESIFVNHIASDLQITFTQGDVEVSSPWSFTILDYYNKCYTGGVNEALDALLANTIVYAHELYLLSGSGKSFDLPTWVATAKTSENPEESDNVQKTTVAALDSANYKIKSASVNVTMKSGLAFRVLANDTTTEAVTLVVNSKTYIISPESPSAEVEYQADGTYIVKLDKISPIGYSTKYSVSLKVGDTVYHAIDYSVNSYCYRMYQKTDAVGQTTTGAVALALYRFGVAAADYKGGSARYRF